MIAPLPSPPRVVLCEGDPGRPLPAVVRGPLLSRLLDLGFAVTRVRTGVRSASPPPGSTLIVVGRFGGSAPEVTDASGSLEVLVGDLEGLTVEDCVAVVERLHDGRRMNRPPTDPAAPPSPDSWKPWFPVIDTARCTNCMQCLSFCLFDVYGVSEDQRLRVENPANCKVNCPACSRVCPDVAIMFPKYHAGPIDGSPVSESDVTREKMKVDISALLGGDIYAKLRERSAEAKNRFSRERSAEQALAERRRCLKKLADAAAIPVEVLDALPSQEEIRRRAEAAAARAAEARAAAAAAGGQT